MDVINASLDADESGAIAGDLAVDTIHAAASGLADRYVDGFMFYAASAAAEYVRRRHGVHVVTAMLQTITNMIQISDFNGEESDLSNLPPLGPNPVVEQAQAKEFTDDGNRLH